MLHGTYSVLRWLTLVSKIMNTEIADMLTEAATLLLVGMSVVFIFLTMLIAAINFIAWVCAKYPESQVTLSMGQRTKSAPNIHVGQVIPASTVAAIGAAIHQHRNVK
jgi:oxaloacetate decarboxylase gamma subunit